MRHGFLSQKMFLHVFLFCIRLCFSNNLCNFNQSIYTFATFYQHYLFTDSWIMNFIIWLVKFMPSNPKAQLASKLISSPVTIPLLFLSHLFLSFHLGPLLIMDQSSFLASNLLFFILSFHPSLSFLSLTPSFPKPILFSTSY